jgi:hypothetical protein
MKIAIMQPYLFPYIGYFQLINAADKFVILDDVNFINRGWINRNRILVQDKAHLFTVPLREVSQNKLIKDLQISEQNNWKAKFTKTIEMNYRKAPFFDDIYNVLKDIIDSNKTLLNSFILYSILKINDYLGIKTPIVDTSSIYENQSLKGEERIIDICLKEKAKIYINPIGGKDIYSKDKFLSKGISLHFLKPEFVTYKQFDNEFVPWLSIVDVLMFNSRAKVKNMLNDYTLLNG